MGRYPSEESVVVLSDLVQLMHGMAGGLDFIVHLFTAIIVALLSQFITMSRLTVPASRRISAALQTAEVSAMKTVEFGPWW
jgi:hypothetical protein